MDALLGQVLDALDASGVAEDTVVAFHSDHGWALGENNMFRKFHNAELTTRVPLVVAVPWMKEMHGKHSHAIVELVDVMPTLIGLANLPQPTSSSSIGDDRVAGDSGDSGSGGGGGEPVPLSGISQAAVLMDAGATLKHYALSQYPRCPADPQILWKRNWCIQVPSNAFGWMGYSIRTDLDGGWRYTAWMPWNGTTLKPVTSITSRTAPPLNGTNGFYEELYGPYNTTAGVNSEESDFNALDVVEVSAEFPGIAATLFAKLVSMIKSPSAPPPESAHLIDDGELVLLRETAVPIKN